MADVTTQPRQTAGGGPGGSGGRRGRNVAFVVLGAAVAIALVVVLALVGLSHHKTLPQAATTTLADPNLSNGAAKAQTVVYANTMVNLSYGGMNRSYLVSRPTTVSRGAHLPVIVELHGHDVTPAIEEQRADFTSVVTPSIIVYPTGYQESWNAGNCCFAAQAAHIDDIGFVKAVITKVKATQPDAQQGRVYLAGYSNGGKLALDLACQDPGDFAAVAVYGATDAAACPSRQSVNLLVMAGTADPQIPANGTPPAPESDGFQPPSFLSEVQSYRDADGCSDQAVVTSVGTVTLTSWVHCADGARVGEAVFAGQTHDWPTGSATTPSGEGVMWAWFKALGASSGS